MIQLKDIEKGNDKVEINKQTLLIFLNSMLHIIHISSLSQDPFYFDSCLLP